MFVGICFKHANKFKKFFSVLNNCNFHFIHFYFFLFWLQVSEVDCRQALEETKWNIESAIKYIKLKQLISTGLADVNRCKEALMKCNWDVEQAADHLLVHPKVSPECVDV